MILMPIVEQHHMVPFHDRFLNSQFKEELNIKKMKERLIARAESSNHWLNELVQELTHSPDTEILDHSQPISDDPMTPEYNFDMISEALSESLEQFEEEVKAAFDSYDYLLENEVSAFPLH